MFDATEAVKELHQQGKTVEQIVKELELPFSMVYTIIYKGDFDYES